MSDQGPEQQSSGPGAAKPVNFFRIFPSIMLPMFLALADQTIVVTALPAIAGDLGGVERVSWVVIAYLIAATIAAPVYGRLGDLLGRRRLLIIALCVFIAASAFCSVAGNMTLLVIGRVLQGLGGGGLMALSQAMLGEAVPPRDRARYQGYLAGLGVTSNTFGPVVGGFLTEHFGWRSIFLVNLPLGILAAVMALRLNPGNRPREPFRFDYLGLVFFAIFIIAVLFLLQQVQRFSEAQPLLLAGLLFVALVALGMFLVTEKRVKLPLIPLQLLREPTIWRSDALAACHGAILISLLTFVPIYLRVVHGTSAGETGLLLLPMTLGIGIGSIITGRIVSKTGRTAIIPSWGLIVVTIALTVVALASPYLSAHHLSWLLGVNALFMGTVMAVVQVTILSAAGPSMLGAASASIQFSRSLGAALGTALVAAVLFSVLAMTDTDAAGLFEAVLQNGPGVLDTLSEARRAVVQAEFADAFRAAFLLPAGFAFIATILMWTIPLRRI